MGLIGDLIRLASVTNTVRQMTKNGVITPDQEKEIWDSAKEAGKRGYIEAKQQQKMEEQRRIRYECCANCRHLEHNSVFSSNMNPYSCTRHDFDFSEEEVRDGELNTTTCDCFWGRQ